MNKATKYTVNGALFGAIINGVINANKQNNTQENKGKFNWQEFFLAALSQQRLRLGTLRVTKLRINFIPYACQAKHTFY
jgi:hypothetical protein